MPKVYRGFESPSLREVGVGEVGVGLGVSVGVVQGSEGECGERCFNIENYV